jgi:hypothetical protein
MNLRDRLNIARPPATPATPKQPTPPAAAQPSGPKQSAPKKGEGPVVIFSCGHARPAAHLAKSRCPACQELGRQAMRKEHDRVLERRRATAVVTTRPATPRFRLPDGSDFHATYSAAAQRWSGTLTVPGLAIPISGEADTVLRLVDLLGHAAHAALQQAAEAEAAEAEAAEAEKLVEEGKEGPS